jgi:restriction system protein
MATRSRNQRTSQKAHNIEIACVVIAAVLTTIIFISPWLAVFLGLSGLLIWSILDRKKRHRDNEEIAKVFARLENLIGIHENALISYFHQSRSKDYFGNIDEKRWHGHIDTFLKTQLMPDTQNFSTWRSSEIGKAAAAMVDRKTSAMIALHKQNNPLARVDVAELTPLEYEHHCAELLNEAGWKIHMTPPTRDGGADFIAEKQSWRIIVQCKRYAEPVGNKAVQEVNSAVRLYQGNIACVVAPNGFTKQAQREAESLSVHLLHHSALPAFGDKVVSINSELGN